MTFKILETMTSEEPSPHAVEHMVPTRDGVQLATDVYLPDDVTTHSAILVRTPYDKSSRYTALTYEAEFFRARGYVFVTQDVRGKFRSTGDTIPYAFDVNDGYDTVEWITQQPWSNGRVGIAGASYYGFTTWAAVASGHPAIKAAIPQVTGIDMGSGHVGGRWLNDLPSFASVNDLLQIWTNNNGYLAEIDWEGATVAEVLAAAREQIGVCIGAEEKIARSATEDWYNPYGERHPYHTTRVPILHWQNWYDPGLAPAGLRDWRFFRSLGGLRDLHYLRVGSADHAGYKLEDVGAGDERNPYMNEDALNEKIAAECGEMADFFDQFLNGVEPTTKRPHARWHVGHVGWQETEEYPPPSTPVTFHLSAAGDNVHSLSREADESPTELFWTHDPSNPVPSTTDIEAIWYLLAAYPDERSLEERTDVLTFRTEPLAGDLDFAGQPILTAEISFTSPSTHLFAKLQDVYPDGTTRPISWGRTVLTQTAGGSVRLVMDDNAYRLRKGHSLQVQIQSSDSPHYVAHPGTGENPWIATEKVATNQSLTIGGLSGATLVIPSVALGRLRS